MSIYTNTARFDTGRALTEDELYTLAPSVFATSAHVSRSERFAPIPTIEIVRGLAKEGFGVVGAKQSLTRVEGKAPFTRTPAADPQAGCRHLLCGRRHRSRDAAQERQRRHLGL